MKKLVFKTAGITLAVIVLILAVTYGVFALFFPGTLGDLFYDTGSYSAGIKYYERQYEKSGDIEDLYTLCVKLDKSQDGDKVKNYTGTFIERKDFEQFCAKKDGSVVRGKTTSEYFEGEYLCAVYSINGMDSAIQEGKGIIERSGYTKYSCFSTLISVYGLKLTDQEIDSLYSELNAMNTQNSNANIQQDMSLLQQLKAS